MYRTILVPLDGTPRDVPVLACTRVLTRASGGRLVLLWAGGKSGVAGIAPAETRARDWAETYLQTVAERLAREGAAVDLVVSSERPIESVLTEVALRHPDLVALAVESDSGEAAVGGPIAASVIARSPAPVLFVPPATDGWRDRVGRSVLAPLDGSRVAEETLPHAVALATCLDATLVLLHVRTPIPNTPSEHQTGSPNFESGLARQERLEAEAYLDRVAARLQTPGLRVQKAVRSGPAVETILEASQGPEVAAVVMSTHGWTGLGPAVLGPVASAVLSRVAVPVLIVRPFALPAIRPPSAVVVSGSE